MTQTMNTHSAQLGHGAVNYGYARCSNITGSFNNATMSDADTQIMHWLTPLELDNRYDGVRNLNVSHIGFWKEASFRSGGEWR